jgi:hypothetical protein
MWERRRAPCHISVSTFVGARVGAAVGDPRSAHASAVEGKSRLRKRPITKRKRELL